MPNPAPSPAPGTRHGLWVILPDSVTDTTSRPDRRVHARCDCGTVRAVRVSTLRNGDSTSCGCVQRLPA